MTVAKAPLIIFAVIVIILCWSIGKPSSQEELIEAYKGKRVIVCGSSYGIGADIARDLAKSGAHIVLTARSEKKLEKVAKECRQLGAASVHIFATDLSTKDGSKSMVEAAEKAMGGIDVLILNHIIGMYQDWAARIIKGNNDHTINDDLNWVDKIFQVNILSYIYISSFALPALSKSGSGRIIAVGSAAGRQGLPRVAPYSSTKHAVFGYFDSLRQDLIASPDKKLNSIGITTGVLGSFGTETARAGTAGKLDSGLVQWADPSIAARDLLKAGARGWNTVYTPWTQIRIASLLHGIFPDFIDWTVRYLTLSGEES
jgi:short-subunit dehydrogenase